MPEPAVEEIIPGAQVVPWRRHARTLVSWTLHPRRVLIAILSLLVLPWAYITAFTPPPGKVALPALDASVRVRVFVVASSYHSSIVVEQPAHWRLGPEGEEEARFV